MTPHLKGSFLVNCRSAENMSQKSKYFFILAKNKIPTYPFRLTKLTPFGSINLVSWTLFSSHYLINKSNYSCILTLHHLNLFTKRHPQSPGWSVRKETSSFFISWFCRNTILWFLLMLLHTTYLLSPLKDSISIFCFSRLKTLLNYLNKSWWRLFIAAQQKNRL